MKKITQQDWEARVKQLTFPSQAFINGQWQTAQEGGHFNCISPIDGQVLTEVTNCTQADVDIAVTAARDAFNQQVWSGLPPTKRKKILLKLAKLINQHQEELALLETLDMGKPINDSLTIDIPAAVQCFQWHAEAIDKVYGEIAPTPANTIGLITREPVGVVGAIVPWNFPLVMACWKVAPALATGNSVILKPSEKSPLTALKLAELAHQAGIPAGVFSVLPGLGEDTGKPIALHPDIDTLAFTGSSRTGKQLLVYAGQSNMKRVWIEAGGKSPNIVFADAPDLSIAAKAAAAAICFNQGEVCTAGSRLLVESSIQSKFLELVQQELSNWQPGHPLNPETQIGAIVDQTQLQTILNYIQLGKKEGAQLVVGGSQCLQDSGGLFVEPTIFGNVSNSMRIAQEEIFGPVLSSIGFSSAEEAICIANDSQYGLAAAVWTKDISKAHRVAKALRAGSVWINQYDGGDMTAPFGGFKQSGNGRDKSLHAFDKYTEIKATWIKL
ncbi:aldehyde dehydrogenase [Spartinivicinus poritis]|uniref:Aldehyde dehydrogenase n=1 Tax=Spartinivicinus poritis TaxID=2994640 RepID=A0ABT5UCX8_9GAMM|nr:aldehyde dehydrogenase [Spartinivicinus sp. A2-2]MDE1464230.1 aldehyde dehydrogenase [Spartinivicinus sp. A2-2]